MLNEAKLALEQGRKDDLRRSAHTLKSNAANFGALSLTAIARELEAQVRDERLENAGELIKLAQAEFEKVRLALEWHQRSYK